MLSRSSIKIATIALLLGSATVCAQEHKRRLSKLPPFRQDDAKKSPVATETRTLSSGSGTFMAYIARPAKGPVVGKLVLVHEWWGLNGWVKQQAERFAEKGYVAIAPDLYHGEVATDAEHAHELMRGLADDRAVADLKATADFLTTDPMYKSEKSIGVMGWCMGGGYALQLAIADPRIACTIMCYGKPINDVDKLKQLKGPLLGIWGADDRGIDVDPFRKALDTAKVKNEHHVHPKSGHAFMNENNQKGYNAEEAAKAWGEIDAFLKKNLAS